LLSKVEIVSEPFAPLREFARQALAENAQAVITERFMRRDPHYREVASYTCELGDIPQVDAAKIIKWLKLQTQIG
jgi:shikimate kinase